MPSTNTHSDSSAEDESEDESTDNEPVTPDPENPNSGNPNGTTVLEMEIMDLRVELAMKTEMAKTRWWRNLPTDQGDGSITPEE